MEYVTPQEMRDAEARAGTYGLGPSELMENAGAAVAKVVEERYARTGRGNVLVVCGLGNNGGDGRVAARHLASGWRVRGLLLGSAAGLKTSEAAKNGALRHTSRPVTLPRCHQARPSNTRGNGATAVLLKSASTKTSRDSQ